MTDIGARIDEGRRCAGVIDSLASKVGELAEVEACELCHILEEFAEKLRVLAADLLETTEAYALHEKHTQEKSLHDGKRGV